MGQKSTKIEIQLYSRDGEEFYGTLKDKFLINIYPVESNEWKNDIKVKLNNDVALNLAKFILSHRI